MKRNGLLFGSLFAGAVLLGASTARAQVVLQSWDGFAAGANAGRWVASVGDVNGDSVGDIAFGEDTDPMLNGNRIRARVKSGADGADLLTFECPPGTVFATTSTVGLGDVNGDGRDDLAVTQSCYDGVTTVRTLRIHSGLDGSEIATLADPSGGQGFFAVDVAAVGDLNGDLVPDVAVGNNGVAPGGRIDVFSGLGGAPFMTILGADPQPPDGQHVGRVLGGGGDYDGDGTPDIATSGLGDGPGNRGSVWVFSGATGAELGHWDGEPPDLSGLKFGAAFGSKLAFVPDANGDGRDELLVADRAFQTTGFLVLFPEAGKIYQFAGGTGALMWSLEGDGAHRQFGHTLFVAGDVDGDGDPEVAASLTQLGSAPGKLRFLEAANGAEVTNVTDPEFQAFSDPRAAGPGDVNGDGRADVVFGFPGRDTPSGVDSGQVVLQTVPLPTPPGCSPLGGPRASWAAVVWTALGGLAVVRAGRRRRCAA